MKSDTYAKAERRAGEERIYSHACAYWGALLGAYRERDLAWKAAALDKLLDTLTEWREHITAKSPEPDKQP